MRPSPPIVPDIDRDTYLVLDDFGGMGCAWRETNVQDTDLESVIDDLLEGQYGSPVRVIGFNTTEGWSRDVSENVAHELRQRCADRDRDLPEFLREFVERCEPADIGEEMTTVAKLLARKQMLLARLQEEPGPNERDEIERLIAEIDEALTLLEDSEEQ